MSTDAKILRQNEKCVYMKVTNLHGFKKMDFAGIHSSTDAFQVSAGINFW